MAFQTNLLRSALLTGKAAVAATLCVLMGAGPALAGEPIATGKSRTPVQSLTEQQRALHTLNRFTFGPRPGDVEAVKKMGLHAWFEQQLNPKSIDDSTLDAMLTRFPAMQLSQQALLQNFPSPQILKRMAQTNAPLPQDPAEHAIYAIGMLNYERRMAMTDASPQGQQAKSADGGGQAMAPAMDGTGNPAMESGAMRAASDAKNIRREPRVEYTGADTATILALPPDARMTKILAMSPEQASAFGKSLSGREREQLAFGLTPPQTEVLMALQGPERLVAAEALETRLVRDAYSARQLEAVMTDFWLNHFSVYVRKNQNEPYMLPSYERDTIRPHALGKFEDLLVATAESPAMLMYLDNWQSVGPDSPAAQRGKRFSVALPDNPLANIMPKGINENYARELIELHTIGVRCEVSKDHTVQQIDRSCGNGYTQADVTNVAKVLTGWTIDKPYQGGGFAFQENRHEGGSKQVFGKTLQAAGQAEGLQVLHMLATSPATAQFISHKLAVRFVSDDPPVALESRMAKTFLASDGDIKAVLRTMFNAPEFWSPTVYRAKVKTPIEFMVSALRASDAKIANSLPLVQAMERLGMPIYGMQTPNGYPWDAAPWVSTTALVSRMNFALVMSGGLLSGTRMDWSKLLGDPAIESASAPSAKTEYQLEMLILGQPAADRTRNAVLEQAAKPGQVHEAKKNLALGSAEAAGGDMMRAVATKGKRSYAAGGASMTDLASATGNDGPVPTMAGLLLGSPEFQRR